MSIPHTPPFKEIEIKMVWTDGTGTGIKDFKSVQHFADFLKENPAFARALGYVPKRK